MEGCRIAGRAWTGSQDRAASATSRGSQSAPGQTIWRECSRPQRVCLGRGFTPLGARGCKSLVLPESPGSLLGAVSARGVYLSVGGTPTTGSGACTHGTAVHGASPGLAEVRGQLWQRTACTHVLGSARTAMLEPGECGG